MKKKVLGLTVLLIFLTGCAGNIKSGVTSLEEGKYQEAIAAFQKDVKKERNWDEAYRGLGIAYFELEDYEKASEMLVLAIENEAEETASIYGILGACYMQLEEYELALDVYEKALTQEDLTKELEQEIQFNLIAVYENTANWEAAKKQMEKYEKLYPEDERVQKEADFLETR